MECRISSLDLSASPSENFVSRMFAVARSCGGIAMTVSFIFRAGLSSVLYGVSVFPCLSVNVSCFVAEFPCVSMSLWRYNTFESSKHSSAVGMYMVLWSVISIPLSVRAWRVPFIENTATVQQQILLLSNSLRTPDGQETTTSSFPAMPDFYRTPTHQDFIFDLRTRIFKN